MSYYKSKLSDHENSPPVHSGVILSFDHATGRGTLQMTNNGTIYPFRDSDTLTFGIYEGTPVLFSINRNGTAYGIAKIVKVKPLVK